MLTSLSGRCIGLSVLVCVLLLFFFPLTQGNFQSTHGPVTALRAQRSVMALFFSIAMAALLVFAVLVLRVFFAGYRGLGSALMHSLLPDFPASTSVLRC